MSFEEFVFDRIEPDEEADVGALAKKNHSYLIDGENDGNDEPQESLSSVPRAFFADNEKRDKDSCGSMASADNHPKRRNINQDAMSVSSEDSIDRAIDAFNRVV